MYKKNSLSLLILLLLLASCSSRYLAKNSCTVVLSMDAFRYDYPDMANTPTFDSLKREGAFAHSIPPFPTLTFPSHYSMATGLYPDHHGIVNNTFYDPELKQEFRISSREAVSNPAFWKGEPIWATAQKQGLKAAVFHWVGSETENQGRRPDVWKPYSKDFTYYQKADSVLAWLALPKGDRPNLIMWYFDEPDHTSHTYGEDAAEVIEKVESIDKVINYLMTKAKENKANKRVNFIFTGDHGMATYTKERYINLSHHVDTTKISNIIFSNPMMVLPKEGELEEVYASLKKVPNIRVYKKNEFPAEWHYGTSDRIYPITILPDTGYRLDFSAKDRPSFGGNHGYDPADKRMHSLFYGVGPAFKKGVVGKDFENINLYQLIARLLHIKPAPNDGNIEAVREMLK